MNIPLRWMSLLIALLVASYAGMGLFSTGGPGPSMFVNQYGQEVEIYGRGIYAHDSAFKAPILRGTDAITLFLAVPALLLAIWLDVRGGMRTRIFLTCMLAYTLYNATSLALGAVYNPLLLVYIGCAGLSFFSFVLAFRSIDLTTLAQQTSPRLPRRWLSGFLFLAGMSLAIWIVDIVVSIISQQVPAHLGHYHTEATYVLDLGIILPAAWLAMVLVWQAKPLGTLLAAILLSLNVSIGFVVASQSIMQALEGIILTPAQYASYVAPFVVLSLVAAVLLVQIFWHIKEQP